MNHLFHCFSPAAGLCNRAILLATAVLLLAALLPQQKVLAGVPVRSALLLNMSTGTILYQKAADLRIPPASLTKVMTSLLVHDAIANGRLSPGTKVRVSGEAPMAGGSTMHLRTGEHITVNNLIEGMLIASGNDAATALAIKVSGSQQRFVDAMNTKAQSLGMSSTTFRNPTGLPASGQLTTARDLMRLCLHYLSNYPEALRIHSQSSFEHGRRTLCTTNPFLGEKGVDGLKTGFTVNSGYNIIVTAKRDGTRLLVIVLGGRTKGRREIAARELLDAGFKTPNSAQEVRTHIDGAGGTRQLTRKKVSHHQKRRLSRRAKKK